MNLHPQEQKYDALIKKLKRKRTCVFALTLIAIFAILIFGSSSSVSSNTNGVTQTIEKDGLPGFVLVLLVILCLFLETLFMAVILAPLPAALNRECDPEKQLILNAHLNRNKRNANAVYAQDYFYLGDYEKCLYYAYKMIETSKTPYVLSGLFHRARCAFFLGNSIMLKESVAQYEQKLAAQKRLSEKNRLMHQKVVISLQMLCALDSNDSPKIAELQPKLSPWMESKANEGFIEYLKARASLALDDTADAEFRFRLVKDQYPKLALARLSDEALKNLSGEDASDEDNDIPSENAEKSSFSEILHVSSPISSYLPPFGQQRILSILLMLGSLLSIWGGLIVVAIVSALTHNYTAEVLWVFYPFALVPILSIAYGFSLKKKGFRYKKNVIIGFIMAIILCIFGSFPIVFKDVYTHSEEPILAVEQSIGLEIPPHARIDTQDWTIGTQEVSRGYIFSTSNVYFDEKNVTTFEAELVGNEHWFSAFPSSMIGITSDFSELASYDYCLLYNIDTNELNKLPTDSGTYRMINLFYNSEDNELLIVEYQIEYLK